jgi:MGT family glycosyltransferase
MDNLPPNPVVHAALGAAPNRPDTVAILKTIINGLADQPLTLILASGRDQDPESLGPLPVNVRVARYIPHSQLLPRCDAIITHAGAGTLIASVAAGLPMVLIPQSGDQPDNAACAAAAGVGCVIAPADLTAETIREATLEVLDNPSYRHSVEALRREIDALPPISRAVALIEKVGREKAPVAANSGSALT